MPDRTDHLKKSARRVSVGASVFFTLASVAGCTGGLNQSDGPLVPSPSDGGEREEPRMPGPLPGPIAPADVRPFTRTADRSTWEKTTVVVEQRQVQAQPTYVGEPLCDRTTARQRGEIPTTTTVLEEGGNGGTMALEAVAAPFWFAWDIVASPVRNVMRPPGTTERVPVSPARLEPHDAQAAAPPPEEK